MSNRTKTKVLPLSFRKAALGALLPFEKPKPGRVLKADGNLHEVLSSPETREWSDLERRQFTALVYGVLRQWFFLDFLLHNLSRHPVNKIPSRVRTLLRLGLYQLCFMDGIPDYAAVDTTVDLARACKLSQKTVAFIHGILREYQRRAAAGGFEIPAWENDPAGHLSVRYAMPPWFARRLLEQYGSETALAMAKTIKTPPPLTLRVNTLKTSVEAFWDTLQTAGIPATQSDEIPVCMLLSDFHGNPVRLPGYAEGHFMVQDIGSAWVAQQVDPQPGEIIVDGCAAPGGKTTRMAAMMENTGTLFAVENSPDRFARFQDNLNRMGITNVTACRSDLQTFELPEGVLADRVLVDAPCSGLGTVRKHPDILVQFREKELLAYPPQQLAVLDAASRWVKPDGILVYSTCSLDRSENQDVAARFLKTHPDFRLLREAQRPITGTNDGFYMAVMAHSDAGDRTGLPPSGKPPLH